MPPLLQQRIYAVTETNVFQLPQPGTFSDPLTEILNGARALLAQAVEAEVSACSAAMPTSSPMMAAAVGAPRASAVWSHDDLRVNELSAPTRILIILR